MTPAGQRMQRGLILRLALADLRHEWILTLCLVLAVSAVIAPLLLLFGLKYGTIETLRSRLIQDPRNREVRPMTSRRFSHEWFDIVRRRGDTAFVIPTTRQISASVTAWSRERGERVALDLVPTGPGDPLLVENGAPAPGDGLCVLSAFAAESMGAVVGDAIVVEASRVMRGRRETGTLELRVAGIVDIRAGATRAVYVPLPLVEKVEAYRDGQAVSEFGWPGDQPEAYPQWDGVVIATPERLPHLLLQRLRAQSGFTRDRALEPATMADTLGYRVESPRHYVLLHTVERPVGRESLDQVRVLLRGHDAVLLPWIRPVAAMIEAPEGGPVREVLVQVLPEEARLLGADVPADWAQGGGSGSGAPCLLPPGGDGHGDAGWIGMAGEDALLRFPVRVATGSIPGAGAATVFVPAPVGGVLRLAQMRPVHYDPGTGALLLSRRGYAGFRLYAARIEDVDGLRRHFEQEGVPVHTEAQRIRTVMEMDRYLSLVFWLVAAVGMTGSVASLVASLYASVERKKKELSVLRLIGFSGARLVRFPVYQGAFLAAGAFAVAMLFFTALSSTINHLFRAHLLPGERFCRLPAAHMAIAGFAAVFVAGLSAVAAVLRLARIDPAEALRDE